MPFAFHSLCGLQHEPQHVRVESAAQTLVGGDDDGADALHLLARHEERMPVLGIRLRDVQHDVEQLLDVRPRRAHPVLRLLHLRRGDHLHRFGDLPRALHALDLVPNLFGSRHRRVPLCPFTESTGRASVFAKLSIPAFGVTSGRYQYVPVFLKSSIAADSAFSSSAVRSCVFVILSMIAGYLPFMNWRSAASNASAFSTGTSS